MAQDYPVIPGDWKPLTDTESTQFLQRLTIILSNTLGEQAFTRRSPVTGLRALPLSFYPGWLLVEGEALLSAETVGTFGVLYGPRFMWLIDGKSRVINSLNTGQLPLPDEGKQTVGSGDPRFLPSPLARLEPETTAPDYLRFFCASVWGDQGPFRLIEDLDSSGFADVADTDGWREKVKPLQMKTVADGIEGAALMHYGDTLFHARLRVAPNGLVEMLSDEPVASGLPQARHEAPFHDIRARAASTAGTGGS